MKDDTEGIDAIVIGLGPAGAAASAILAEHGRCVVAIERDVESSYRVGESLIPFCWHPLQRLGVVDDVRASGFVVEKNSVQFAGLEGGVSKPFYFFEHTDHPCARTWQVVRQDFDRVLRENAASKGAQLRFGHAVRSLVEEDGAVRGVQVQDEDGNVSELRAPVTIDASGRATFAQTKLGWRVPDQKLRKVAIWTYYEGAKRDTGIDEGTTTIAYLPEKGWFWYIPLPNDRVGVGVVAEKDYLFGETRSPEEIFQREAAIQPWIRDRLSTGRVIDEYRVTSEFSYRSRHCAKDGLVLAGDAFSFLDPVFSSGVYFALESGVRAGDAVHAALAAGDTSAASFEGYGSRFLEQIEPMRKLVHAFYDGDFNFGKFLKRYPDLRADLTDCLIGDLDRNFDPFFRAVSELAELPEPLPHGGPLVRRSTEHR